MKTLKQEQLQAIAGGLTSEQIEWLESVFRDIAGRGLGFPVPTPDIL